LLKKRQTFPSRLLHQFINLFVGFEKKITEKKNLWKKDHVPHWWYTTVHIIRWPLVTEPLCDLKKIKESGVFSIILHQMIVNVKKNLQLSVLTSFQKTTFLPFSWFYSYFLFFETICDQLFWLLFNSRALCFVVS